MKCLSNVRLRVIEEKGNILEVKVQQVHNLVVDAGCNMVRDLIRGTIANMVTHIAFGHGTTAPIASNTELEDEHIRKAFYPDYPPSASAKTLTYGYTLQKAEGAMGVLSEIGLFTASTAGIMYARATFTGINKTADNTIIVSWELSWDDDGV